MHVFTGTWAAMRNSGSGHEKGGRCGSGSLAQGVGQLLVIHTPVRKQRGPLYLEKQITEMKDVANGRIIKEAGSTFLARYKWFLLMRSSTPGSIVFR